MANMYVSQLWIYPIKSCRGIAVEQFTLDDRGPENDRRWMLVDERGQFLSQREFPRLALVDVRLASERITVSGPSMSAVSFATAAGTESVSGTVWGDAVELLHVSRAADQWFSSFLGSACQLVRMPIASERVVDPDYSPERRLVSLADAFPMLLIGTGSLDLLNQKLAAQGAAAIPMMRFRPNVVVSSTEPHEEDGWRRVVIGDVACHIVKPCARCVTTTVDVDTGVKGVEPLRTLSTYRKRGSKVWFGQNVIHERPGTIHRGDAVMVDRRAAHSA